MLLRYGSDVLLLLPYRPCAGSGHYSPGPGTVHTAILQLILAQRTHQTTLPSTTNDPPVADQPPQPQPTTAKRRHHTTDTATTEQHTTSTTAHPVPLQDRTAWGRAGRPQGDTTAAAFVAGGLHHHPQPGSRLAPARVRAVPSTPRDPPYAATRTAPTPARQHRTSSSR